MKTKVTLTIIFILTVLTALTDFIMGDHSAPAWKGQWPFVGLIDEVRIYDRDLSKDEVNQNFLVKEPFKAAVTTTGKLALTWGDIKVSK